MILFKAVIKFNQAQRETEFRPCGLDFFMKQEKPFPFSGVDFFRSLKLFRRVGTLRLEGCKFVENIHFPRIVGVLDPPPRPP